MGGGLPGVVSSDSRTDAEWMLTRAATRSSSSVTRETRLKPQPGRSSSNIGIIRIRIVIVISLLLLIIILVLLTIPPLPVSPVDDLVVGHAPGLPVTLHVP
jgi:hypothetical protein